MSSFNVLNFKLFLSSSWLDLVCTNTFKGCSHWQLTQFFYSNALLFLNCLPQSFWNYTALSRYISVSFSKGKKQQAFNARLFIFAFVYKPFNIILNLLHSPRPGKVGSKRGHLPKFTFILSPYRRRGYGYNHVFPYRRRGYDYNHVFTSLTNGSENHLFCSVWYIGSVCTWAVHVRVLISPRDYWKTCWCRSLINAC